MKNLLRLLTALSFCSILHAATPLKVVTWNLEWFPGKTPKTTPREATKHMKDAQEALKKLNPDVFIAVEIRDWAALAELVAVIPGLQAHVVSNFIDPNTGEIRPQQIGIASKLTCRAAAWEAWKPTLPDMARGFSFTALEQKNGSLLMVYGLHLKSNRGDASEVAAMRNEQTLQLIAQRAIMEKAFVGKTIGGWIATGDFNTNHDGQFPLCKVVEEMTQAGFRNTWADTPQNKRLTWSSQAESEFKPTTFDYFFTLGLGSPNAILLDTPESVSDHHAIGLAIPQQ